MSNNTSSLAKKMVLVMRECGYIQKDQRNDFHKYKYASAAAVLEKVNDALVKHGVSSYCRPEILSSEIVANAKGAQEKFITVKNTIVLVDGESGESMEISGIGSGQDAGDKAIAKAQTMAIKYAWMLTLNISTGDDPEEDSDLDERSSPVHFWIERFRGVKNQDEFNSAKAELLLVYNRLSMEEKKRINDAAMASKSKFTEGSN